MYASSLHSASLVPVGPCTVYLLLGLGRKEGLTVSDDALVENNIAKGDMICQSETPQRRQFSGARKFIASMLIYTGWETLSRLSCLTGSQQLQSLQAMASRKSNT